MGKNTQKKKVLVIDDEEPLREIIKEVLGMLKMEVIQAETGIQAIEIVSALDAPVDLMIIDLHMPNMTGEETFEKLRSRFPDCPVLFISGHYGNSYKSMLDEKTQFLKKPFSLNELQKAVSALL
mgnify:CR=1 FL=1